MLCFDKHGVTIQELCNKRTSNVNLPDLTSFNGERKKACSRFSVPYIIDVRLDMGMCN